MTSYQLNITRPVIRSGRWIALCLVLTIGAACTTNPVTGERELSLVSEQQELAMGAQYYAPYRQQQGGDYVADKDPTQYVQSVAQRLVAVSDRQLPYEFHIINDSTPNAWALPGGKIALHRGLLLALQNEAELAAVLAHEIIHAAARHSAQSMQRDMLLQGAVLAAGVALADSKYQKIGALGASLGANLTQFHFSRDAERESDEYGIRYMVRAGYDPQAAVSLQETFVKLKDNKAPNWLEGLFASHPPSQERVQNNRRLVQALGNPGGRLGEAAYQQATAHLRQTQSAYQLYDQATAALRDKQPEQALSLVNEALQIEPKEALFHGLRGHIRYQQGRDQAAMTNFERAIKLNPDYFEFHLARGLLQQKRDNRIAAQRDLQVSVDLLPTPEALFGLGELAQTAGDRKTAIEYFGQVAQSQSDLAQNAGERLARLDLAKHPARFLSAQLTVNPDQQVLIRVHNRSVVSVHQVRVTLGEKVGSDVQIRDSLRLAQSLAPGAEVVLKSGIRVADRLALRRLVAQVVQAQVLN